MLGTKVANCRPKRTEKAVDAKVKCDFGAIYWYKTIIANHCSALSQRWLSN